MDGWMGVRSLAMAMNCNWIGVGKGEAGADFAEGMIRMIEVEIGEETRTMSDDPLTCQDHDLSLSEVGVLVCEMLHCHQFLRGQSGIAFDL